MLLRSLLPRCVLVFLFLCVSADFSAEAAPPPAAARDRDWYKAALELHIHALQEMSVGQVDAAILKLERALVLSEKNQSNDYILLTLGYLTNAYTLKRDVAKVEELFVRKYEIAKKTYDPKSFHFAAVLNEFGHFARQMGQLERAESMLKEAVAIYATASGPAAIGGVAAMKNLANVYVALGNLDLASELFDKALSIQESVYGKENLDIATTLSDMAVVAHHRGDLARAEEVDRRACAMIEAAGKSNDFPYAQCIANLGYVLQSKGEYPEAKELIEKSIDIQRQALGVSHPRIAATRGALGQLHLAMGDVTTAVRIYDEAIAVNDKDLDIMMVSGTEAHKRDFLGRIVKQTEAAVSLHLMSAPNDAAARSLALRTILRRKGRVLDAMAQNVSVVRQHMNAEETELLDQLESARTDLARAVLGGAGAPPLGSPQQMQLEKQARTRTERLEKEIGKRSAQLRGLGEEVSIERVQASVPKDAALIEFIRFQPFNAKWKKRAEAWEEARYAAYVLTATGDPQTIDLGSAEAIDQAITGLRAACADSKRSDARSLAKALDELILRPILKKVPMLSSSAGGKPKTLFISPDGALNLLPFAALVDEQGKHRVETLIFDYVTSGRDLMRFSEPPAPPRQRPFVLANADFGPKQPKGTVKSAFRVYFSPLAGTIEEGRVVAAMLPGSTLVTEGKAIEQTVKALHGPEALHLATHGYFRGESKSVVANSRALELEMSNVANSGSGAKTLQTPIENPLLRSGLAMAGANLRRGTEDGLLTALEVSGMDLWGTKLVVLSACETGLGDVTAGEGVYGLRRAFAMAGAQTTLMSLWEVDDEATRDLMIAYYQRMAAGEGRAEALRTAQLSLLHNKTFEHPFFWGAFLASGDPRPVDFAVVPPKATSKAVVPAKRGCACEVVEQDQASGVWAMVLLAGVLGRRYGRKPGYGSRVKNVDAGVDNH